MTGDDLLTAYYQANPRTDADTEKFFKQFDLDTLREAADLCGIDAVELTRRQSIRAIINNF